MSLVDNRSTRPDRNMRITFWGVQGSCPIFPTRAEVDEYAGRIAAFVIERTLADLVNLADQGRLNPAALKTMQTPDAVAEYQRRMGLPVLPVYGGETTCIEVNAADGNTFVFDMGTGFREFSKSLLARTSAASSRTVHVFGSHEHLDHRIGLPFAGFCFDHKQPFQVQVYGTPQYLKALDDRYGIYSHRTSEGTYVDDPIDYRMFSAVFTGSEIRQPSSLIATDGAQFGGSVFESGKPISIGATTITPFDVYHGATRCLAYKVQCGGSAFVFCTDHELRHGADPSDPRQIKSIEAERRLIEQCRDVDLAYFDGQYLLDEYEGVKGIGSGPGICRRDWGHSCIEDAVARTRDLGIKQTFIGHHDPERPRGDRAAIDNWLAETCRGQPFRIELAKVGAAVDL